MRKIVYRLWLVCLLSCLGLVACEVDFTPNAEWKEVPVVYCLIDQDDDTTWARIEKCYLGDGSIYQYATHSDSINFPSGYIQAYLVAYNNDVAVDSLCFQEIAVDRSGGEFANQGQPTYYCLTRNWLNEAYTYRLRIRRTSDGMIIGQSLYAISLIKKNADDSLFIKPYSGRRFAFKDGNATCQIEWNALENARLYQPYVRLYYESQGDTTYTEAMCQQIASTNIASSYAINYGKDAFLTSVKANLKQDTEAKRYLAMVDIYLLACSEDLKSYLYSTSRSRISSEINEPYTNMDNCIGIFAARRTHLYKRMPADDSDLPGGLRRDLRELGVGF